MSSNLNIRNLPHVDEIQPGDFLLVEIPTGSRILDFKNLIISKDNITFASELSGMSTNIDVLLARTDTLTGALFFGDQDLLASTLSARFWLSAGSGMVINNVKLTNNNDHLIVHNHLSAAGVVYASGGNSDQWGNTYTVTNAGSANWTGAHTQVAAYSASWLNTFNTTKANSGDWENVETTVRSGSGSWAGGSTKWTEPGGSITHLTNAANKVGIGSAAPSEKLSVAGNISASGLIKTNNDGTSQNWYDTYSTTAANSGDWQNVETVTRANSASWAPGGSISFGTDKQIPFMNSDGDDFDYHADLAWGDDEILKINGGVQIKDKLWHKDDSNTFFHFQDPDIVRIVVAGNEYLSIDMASANEVCINENGESVDFRVEGDADANLLFVDGSADKVGIGTSTPNELLTVKGNISAASNIRAAGNLSADGDAHIAGTLYLSQSIRHIDDVTTRMWFSDDRIQFEAGGITLFGVHKKSSAPHQVTINNGGNNVDFVVNDDDTVTYFRADASRSRIGIGIGDTTPSEVLTVGGNISASGLVKTLDDGTSQNWFDTYTTVSSSSSDWQNVETVTRANSSAWAGGSKYTSSASFEPTDGVITFTRSDSDTYTVSIDGRYPVLKSALTNTYIPVNTLTGLQNSVIRENSSAIGIGGLPHASSILSVYGTISGQGFKFGDSAGENSTDWKNMWTRVSTDSATWDDQRFLGHMAAGSAKWWSTHDAVSANSGDWESVWTTVNTDSADWNNAETALRANSGDWENTETKLRAESGDWENMWTRVSSNSANWNSTYSKTFGASAKWENTYSIVRSASAKWWSTHDAVTANSGDWKNVWTTVNTDSADWNNTETTLRANSGDWNNTETRLRAKSGDWDSVWTTVNTDSADWNNTETALRANSGDWENTETTLRANSSDWENNWTTVNTDSADWNNTHTKLRSVSGVWTAVNTNSADWENTYTRFINVSAGFVSTQTGVNSNSGDWENVVTVVNANSGDWDNTETTLRANSSDWNNTETVMRANSGDWNNTETRLRANSGDWENTETTLRANSGDWDNTETRLRAESGDWENMWTKVNAQSGDWENNWTTVNTNSGDWQNVETVTRANSSAWAGSTVWTVDGDNIYYDDGKVGIGTTTPNRTLHIHNATNPAASNYLQVTNHATGEASDNDGFRVGVGSDSTAHLVQGENAGMAFSVNNSTEAMRILAGGNVGIGTTAPTEILHVAGVNDAARILIQETSSDTGDTAALLFKTGATTADDYVKGGIFFEDDGSGAARGKMHIAVDSANNNGNVDKTDAKITILNDGNVGIGTTSPDCELHIEGSGTTCALIESTAASSAKIGFKNTSREWSILNKNSLSGKFSIDEDGTERLVIADGGKVGIGLTTPSTLLHLSGGDSEVLRIESNDPDNAAELTMHLPSGSLGSLYSDKNDTVLQRIRGSAVKNNKIKLESDGDIYLNAPDDKKVYIVDDESGHPELSILASGTSKDPVLSFEGSFTGTGKIYVDEDAGKEPLILCRTAADGTENIGIGIADNGQVGIGTTNPDATLHIYDATDAATLKLQSDPSDDVQIQFFDTSTKVFEILYDKSESEVALNASTGKTFSIGTNGTADRLTLDGNGNLAITGDITITGDDIVMGTNTDGYMLVANGTNYSPVAISGAITIANTGVTTLAGTAISSLTDTTLATGDYLMFWDATDSALKKVDADEVLGGGGTTYTHSWVDSSDDVLLRLTPSAGDTADIKIVSGDNITLTHTDANNFTISSTDTNDNDNTTYSISCVDGGDEASEKIRLTAGGSGSGNDDVTLAVGTGLSIARSGDTITFTNTETDTTIPDTDTTYTLTAADGDNTDEEKIVLTAGGDGSGSDELVLEAGTGLSIARDGTKITFTNSISDTTIPDTDTTYTPSWVDDGANAKFRLTAGGDGSGEQDLTIVAGDNITVTPDGTNLTIAAANDNTQLSTEQVQDIVGAMFSGNTETRIAATYEGSDGTIDLVVNDMSGGGIDGTGSAGSVPIWSDSDTLTNDGNNLYYNTTNHHLGIGKQPSYRLDVDAGNDATRGINLRGALVASGDITAFSTSDRRLKNNITPISDSLSKIDKINGVVFDWTDNAPDYLNGTDYGVIAQDVEEVLPAAVTERSNGYKAVNYEKMIPLMVECIKDLKQEVEDLREQLKNK